VVWGSPQDHTSPSFGRPGVDSGEGGPGGPHALHRSGEAAVDGELGHDFLYLFPGHAVVEGARYVDGQFLGAAQEGSVRLALTEVADRQRDLAVAEANLQHAMRVLHATGGSLREIADAVGVSRQRIHQIVKATGGVPGRRRRKATGGTSICSFCDRNQAETIKVIAGPDVFICDGCIRRAVPGAARGTDHRCSFCGKTGQQGSGLADRGGGAPRICGECLVLCHEILAEEPNP
jgi:hypothetical protein